MRFCSSAARISGMVASTTLNGGGAAGAAAASQINAIGRESMFRYTVFVWREQGARGTAPLPGMAGTSLQCRASAATRPETSTNPGPLLLEFSAGPHKGNEPVE